MKVDQTFIDFALGPEDAGSDRATDGEGTRFAAGISPVVTRRAREAPEGGKPAFRLPPARINHARQSRARSYLAKRR
jgi:hypothetical protein